jgi:hypothetical protein
VTNSTDDDDAPEYLGTYRSLDDYFRSVLAEFIAPPAQWLLDALDMKKVRKRFDGDRAPATPMTPTSGISS